MSELTLHGPLSFEFNSPMTKEDWDKLQDNEMEDTAEVTFKTPSGKRVTFRKVKHGEWIVKNTERRKVFYCSKRIAHCPYCGHMEDRKIPNFCPHCGADLRGETE